MKYQVWTSTTTGNNTLNNAFTATSSFVYLFYSVNKSNHFQGVATMLSNVDPKMK